ncbi:unnamed protein product [Sphacelaria rigidula]
MTSIKLVMAVVVQREWSLYHFDVTQAFVQAEMDTDVYMRLPEGCSVLTDVTAKLEKSIFAIKQAGRQLLADVGMVQCEADPCVFKMEDAGDVRVALVVHVDDILISGSEEYVGKAGKILNKTFPTSNLGERFEVRGYSEIPASVSVKLGPTSGEDKKVNCPHRKVVGGLMWLATVTRPDIANSVRALARQSHDPCERHWEALMKVLKYLNETREFGLTFKKGHDRPSVYCDADYAQKETDRRLVSGVPVMYSGVVVSATSRTQHCVTLSTTEAKYVAMAEGAKEGLFVKAVLTSL